MPAASAAQVAKALKNVGVSTLEVPSALVRMSAKDAGALEALAPVAGDEELNLLVDGLEHGDYAAPRVPPRPPAPTAIPASRSTITPPSMPRAPL